MATYASFGDDAATRYASSSRSSRLGTVSLNTSVDSGTYSGFFSFKLKLIKLDETPVFQFKGTKDFLASIDSLTEGPSTPSPDSVKFDGVSPEDFTEIESAREKAG